MNKMMLFQKEVRNRFRKITTTFATLTKHFKLGKSDNGHVPINHEEERNPKPENESRTPPNVLAVLPTTEHPMVSPTNPEQMKIMGDVNDILKSGTDLSPESMTGLLTEINDFFSRLESDSEIDLEKKQELLRAKPAYLSLFGGLEYSLDKDVGRGLTDILAVAMYVISTRLSFVKLIRREVFLAWEKFENHDLICDSLIELDLGLVNKEVLFVSHKWLGKLEPDPDKFQFNKVKRHLLKHEDIKLIWVDYCCLPQKDFNYRNILNVPEFMSHCSVLVLEDELYYTSVWCLVELAITKNTIVPQLCLQDTMFDYYDLVPLILCCMASLYARKVANNDIRNWAMCFIDYMLQKDRSRRSLLPSEVLGKYCPSSGNMVNHCRVMIPTEIRNQIILSLSDLSMLLKTHAQSSEDVLVVLHSIESLLTLFGCNGMSIERLIIQYMPEKVRVLTAKQIVDFRGEWTEDCLKDLVTTRDLCSIDESLVYISHSAHRAFDPEYCGFLQQKLEKLPELHDKLVWWDQYCHSGSARDDIVRSILSRRGSMFCLSNNAFDLEFSYENWDGGARAVVPREMANQFDSLILIPTFAAQYFRRGFEPRKISLWVLHQVIFTLSELLREFPMIRVGEHVRFLTAFVVQAKKEGDIELELDLWVTVINAFHFKELMWNENRV
jgi:hypothetical protein